MTDGGEVIEVLVDDDHTLFLQGIVTLLEPLPDIRVTGQAGTGQDALELARELRPDVVVMDIMMQGQDGITTAGALRSAGVDSAIILVTMYREWRFIERARREAAVSGYVLKQDAFEDLVSAIRSVHQGSSFFSPSLVNELGLADDKPGAVLTDRERQILALIAEGYSSQAITEQLGLSIKTVETHRRHISQKLGLRGPADFTRYAIKMGMVQP